MTLSQDFSPNKDDGKSQIDRPEIADQPQDKNLVMELR